jgi:hypothetical protein
MTEPRDDRFTDPMPVGEPPADFLPDLQPSEPAFIQKLAKLRGFAFQDQVAKTPDS